MIINKAHIATNYGRIDESGRLYVWTYCSGGVKEVPVNTGDFIDHAGYSGQVFIITDGADAVQNLRMWLYYNNNQEHACYIDVTWPELKPELHIQLMHEPAEYSLSCKSGTILGVRNGLPFEVEFNQKEPE